MTDHHRRLADAAKRYREAQAELEAARLKLAERVQAAAGAGVRPVEILRAIGNVWTREYIRKLTLPREVPWQEKEGT